MNEYICRDCRSKTTGTQHQIFVTRRVVCPGCGGTCDPSPKLKKRIDKMYKRLLDREAAAIDNQYR